MPEHLTKQKCFVIERNTIERRNISEEWFDVVLPLLGQHNEFKVQSDWLHSEYKPTNVLYDSTLYYLDTYFL